MTYDVDDVVSGWLLNYALQTEGAVHRMANHFIGGNEDDLDAAAAAALAYLRTR